MLSQVVTPGELKCLGFIQDELLPMDVFIAGLKEDENHAYAAEGSVIYLNGPGIPTLKPGETYRIVRPEGKVRDRLTYEVTGIYYVQLGTLRVEAIYPDGAIATVRFSCFMMHKGDLVLPLVEQKPVEFTGDLSTPLTPVVDGLVSSVVLGEQDKKELAAGQFCYIGVGSQDGVKPGDRFTIYRDQPPFNHRDLLMHGGQGGLSYERLIHSSRKAVVTETLRNRKLPPRPVGDLVVVHTERSTAVAKIINSLSEIHPGDLIIRR
jgi:hypothetical protein